MEYSWYLYKRKPKEDGRLRKVVGAAKTLTLDLFEEHSLALSRKRNIAHFVIFLDENDNFMDNSQLSLRSELELDRFYELLASCPKGLPDLSQTKGMVHKDGEEFGISKFQFKEPLPVPPEDKEIAKELKSELFKLMRELMDSHPLSSQETLLVLP